MPEQESTQPISEKTLEILKSFDTPTVCNVIELFDMRPDTEGFMNADIKACFDDLPPMVGFAATATYRASDQQRHANAYEMLNNQIESFSRLPGPPVVVFEDLDDPPCAATFGDVMCGTYKAFGATGLITSGLGRDLDQVRALDFPVFTSGIVCSHGYPQIVDIDLTVRVGGLEIVPGDLIHADRNGVLVIPTQIAATVASVCHEYADIEAIILDYVNQSPSVTSEGFSRKRDEAKVRMRDLRNRLSQTVAQDVAGA